MIVFGVLCALVELQSSSLIYWTGDRVQGTNEGGIVYYTVDGQQRTLDQRGEPPARPVRVAVYVDPDDSSRDRLASPVKWFDAAFVLAPFAAAGIVLAAGIARRRRSRERLAAAERRRRDQATSDWLRLRREGGPPPSRSNPSR